MAVRYQLLCTLIAVVMDHFNSFLDCLYFTATNSGASLNGGKHAQTSPDSRVAIRPAIERRFQKAIITFPTRHTNRLEDPAARETGKLEDCTDSPRTD